MNNLIILESIAKHIDGVADKTEILSARWAISLHTDTSIPYIRATKNTILIEIFTLVSTDTITVRKYKETQALKNKSHTWIETINIPMADPELFRKITKCIQHA